MKSGESAVSGGELVILENFKTQQQTTEWTCGLTSALMALEWFGANPGQPGLLSIYSDAELAAVADAYEDLDVDDLRDDRLTEINLARLRGEGRTNPGATTLDDMMNIFDNLNNDDGYLKALAAANGWDTIHKWSYLTTDDLSEESEDGFIVGEDGEEHYLADGIDGDGLIPYCLGLGYPVLIGWDEWGGHWQVIIGYDDMGTADTQDDVLILADPYDTTDQNQDGYYLEAFERLIYGWGARFDERGELVFIIPYLTDTEIPFGAYGSGGISVTVDGKALAFDVPPRNLNGRIVVPLRAIFEAMGADIDWDEAEQTVTATKGDTVVTLAIGEATATVNGEAVQLDQPGILQNGRTLAPLRFVAETFGGSVYWDGDAQTAAITM
jgi:hypothetical protein